ncbi:DNA translocase FtsK 4TM domain-containing protein [Thermomicrobium sp. 4228-Ro]|uniref:FtsK/SpoIIIE family DNA translocase n=1 Tax=Thermomicrobium sp. 4228-Ro TaxID=2993937 RepID=UPI00224944A0|nr:DNA translocase FtsK [Thermomicrobium sp. 4228-Ro]MCX2727325.1 DNA translocase FtsK 4TM domain-containing protein [Thermomicrobium sp. 4228-Ro]
MARGRSQGRKRGEAREVRSERGGSQLLPWLLGRVARGLAHVPRRLPRDLAGLFLATLGVLLALALFGAEQRTGLIGLVAEACRWLFGRGAIVVPLVFFWGALELLAAQSRQATLRRALGIFLYIAGAVALLDARAVDRVEEAGGYLGAGVAAVLRLIGGEIGFGVLALVLGVAGVTLFAGVDLRTLGQGTARVARLLGAVRSWRPPVQEGEQQSPSRGSEREGAVDTTEFAMTRPVIAATRHTGSARARNRRGGGGRSGRGESVVATGAEDTAPEAAGNPIGGDDVLPDISRLQQYATSLPDAEELERKAAIIQETLANFRVDARVREIYPGPAVTLFTLEPGPGVKVRRITELQNDLALALAAPAIRIEAPVPGMARVGIEVPNAAISTVGLREVLESPAFQRSRARLPLALGRDVHGEYVVADLTRMPHLLIAGATGSGKSVCINGIIATFLLTRRPDELQMLLIDPKKVELAGYDGVPHLKRPVVTDMGLVVGALRRVLQEMERRYERFAQLGVRNLEGYRLRREEDPSLEPLPYLVVIIDELADLMLTTPDEVETLLVRLAQMARATGIHLLIATQRPSVDVLTGLIKANVPARIAFAVTSQTDSRVILDMPGAERLLGRGDMLYLPPDAPRPLRIQGSFIDDRDLEYVVDHWRRLYPVPQYDPTWLDLEEATTEPTHAEDPLLEQARQLVRQLGAASTSLLQRRLRIGYNRAARIMEQLEAEGIVGPADGARGRMVYLGED